jgi:hypothetical protein
MDALNAVQARTAQLASIPSRAVRGRRQQSSRQTARSWNGQLAAYRQVGHVMNCNLWLQDCKTPSTRNRRWALMFEYRVVYTIERLHTYAHTYIHTYIHTHT